MPPYRDLGPSMPLTATPDQTGNNPGNWTIVAGPQELNCKVAQAEVYQMTINGPAGTTFKLLRNGRLWNDVIQGYSNVYDPVNPLYVRPGDSLNFYWRADTSRLPAPTVTLWLRYDLQLPENVYPGTPR